ncbi:MAG: hypothetical protein RL357_1665 [Pseudomonadota bacterium]
MTPMMTPADCLPEEIYAATIANLLQGVKHVAVGMLSPIPGAGALLAKATSDAPVRVSILGSHQHNPWTNGGNELFDVAGRGGIGAFFLSGGQIDGHGNINLVGVGDYPATSVRWSGSFGSAYLYFLVPKVILFRWEHSRRTLVDQVDFISAPGRSDPGVYRPGGPVALMTNLCLFAYQKDKGRFKLESIHPGHSIEEVRDQTGFDFDAPEDVPTTALPSANQLALLRGPVADQMVEIYPKFAAEVFGRTGQASLT